MKVFQGHSRSLYVEVENKESVVHCVGKTVL